MFVLRAEFPIDLRFSASRTQAKDDSAVELETLLPDLPAWRGDYDAHDLSLRLPCTHVCLDRALIFMVAV